MSLHIGMDKHGVRWKDRENCWLFGQIKSGFRALQAKKEEERNLLRGATKKDFSFEKKCDIVSSAI